MKNALTALVKVKSLVTLLLTAVFCGLAWRGVVSGEQFMTVFGTVIAFYFGTQSERNGKQSNEKQ